MGYLLTLLLLILLNSCGVRTGMDKQPNSTPGIVYFSDDNGNSWKNKSDGLPDDIFLTDIAVSDQLLGVATKQNGVFMYSLEKNSWSGINRKPETSADFDALYLFRNRIFVGTHGEGVFASSDNGKNWVAVNNGLDNLAIRKFAEIDNKLYAGTNGGLYGFNEQENEWHPEYGNNSLQVNGIIEFGGEMYIGTNQGAFKSSVNHKDWIQVLSGYSLHNISSAGNVLYALAYNELLASNDKGKTWQNVQQGMPPGKYSFQLIQKDNAVFVGQWDGVYKKDIIGNWKLANNGLPDNAPITEMKIYKGIIVGASSQWIKKQAAR